MSELRQAYGVLGLEPGSSKEKIQIRYKRLIMVWHPDRFPTAEGKRDAEEELKKINNGKDLLFGHFDSGLHQDAGCDCCQPAGHTTGLEAGNGSGAMSGTEADEEEEVRRRDARRRAAADEQSHARSDQQETSPQTASQPFADAEEQQTALKDQRLRWKVAVVEVIAFVLICLFGVAGNGLKDWWHDLYWHWQQGHPNSSSRIEINITLPAFVSFD